MNPSPPPDPTSCPLCGQANACAAAAAGTTDVDCWCRTLRFPPTLLARVPHALQGRACICRACAEAEQAAQTPQGVQSAGPGSAHPSP